MILFDGHVYLLEMIIDEINKIKKYMGLNESVKYDSIKKSFDIVLDEIKQDCNSESEDRYEWVPSLVCELFFESDGEIEIIDVERKNNVWNIKINITYKNHFHFHTEDVITWELSDRIKKWVGKNYIEIVEMKNTFPEHLRQW